MRFLAVTTAALALLTVPVPNSSASTAATRLVLSVTRAEATSTASLSCQPNGGSHPRAADACADLLTAKGDFNHLPTHNGICPMIYQPVTARASGRWHGRPVSWEREFTNYCALANGTDKVFTFYLSGQTTTR